MENLNHKYLIWKHQMCELIKLQSWLPKISFYSQKKKISQFYYNDVNL